ncbi:MAG: hypothetical protein GQ527_07115, partial [Bacteroidales bacterium]|nr:hypothetical protein [Bacteroidales bacterium]
MRIYLAALLLIFSIQLTQAQDHTTKKDKVLFSGVIVENDSLKPVSFARIKILNKNIGTLSTIEGYFSFYAEEQDSISFSALGFSPVLFVIPKTIETERYSIIQVMVSDTLELAETIIYPWPVNETDFKESFLNDEIADDEVEQAIKNIQISAIQQPREIIFHEASAAYNFD